MIINTLTATTPTAPFVQTQAQAQALQPVSEVEMVDAIASQQQQQQQHQTSEEMAAPMLPQEGAPQPLPGVDQGQQEHEAGAAPAADAGPGAAPSAGTASGEAMQIAPQQANPASKDPPPVKTEPPDMRYPPPGTLACWLRHHHTGLHTYSSERTGTVARGAKPFH